MTVTYTPQEMLAQWRLRRHLLPSRNDAGIEIEYGVDVDSLCRSEMRQWYLGLLATAPLTLVPVEDITAQVSMSVDDDGVGLVELPDNVVRVVGIETDDWLHPAIIVTDPDEPLALMQRGHYSRGARFSPVAVVDGRTVRLYSFNDGGRVSLTHMRCVCVPGDGSYRFDERALDLITSNELKSWKEM